jgi:hypothetical protein
LPGTMALFSLIFSLALSAFGPIGADDVVL